MSGLRDARPADLDRIAAIHVAGWQTAYAGIIPAELLSGLDVADYRARHEARLGEGHGAYVVVEDVEGVVAGFAVIGRCLDEDLSDAGQVYAIYVDPSSWARGLGSLLLHEAMTRLRAMGFINASLWVLRDNLRARRFYESRGWAPDGREKQRVIGAPVVEIRYRLDLV